MEIAEVPPFYIPWVPAPLVPLVDLIAEWIAILLHTPFILLMARELELT